MKTDDLERSLVSPSADAGAPAVVVIHSPDASLAQRLFSLAAPLTIGRPGEGAGGERLSIADSRISREHALLSWRADGRGCEVRDLDSHNGTFADGRRVRSEWVPPGSLLRVGDSFLEVTVQPEPAPPHPSLLGQSAALHRLLGEIHRVARSEVSLLIEGETGTGKELVATALHDLSGRAGKLVAINCASIPPAIAESYLFGHKKGAFTGASHDLPGVFAQADEGTLFLDEIGELRLDLQSKLLRVLETREFSPVGAAVALRANARFLSATNARLRVQVSAGTFRSDLFARVAGVELAVPSLRQRRSDIPILMAHFFAQAAVRFEFSPTAMEALLLHDWPMNVRELKSVCGRLALRHPSGGSLRSADVAAALHTPEPARAAPEAAEGSAPSRVELFDLLQAHQGNVVKLAAHYGKDRKQIYRWLELHRLDPRDFR